MKHPFSVLPAASIVQQQLRELVEHDRALCSNHVVSRASAFNQEWGMVIHYMITALD